MSDAQIWQICQTILMVYALYRVTAIALLAVGRAIPDKGFKDL